DRGRVCCADRKIEARGGGAEPYIPARRHEQRVCRCAGRYLEYGAVGGRIVDGEEARAAARAVIDRDPPFVGGETGRNTGVVEEDAQIVLAQHDRVKAEAAGRRTIEPHTQAAVDVEILREGNTRRHGGREE